jgi:hypothetical protein
MGWPANAGDVAVTVVTVALALSPATAGAAAAVRAVATKARVAPIPPTHERDRPFLLLGAAMFRFPPVFSPQRSLQSAICSSARFQSTFS